MTRILVVEDEPTMAALIRGGLADEGLATDVASSGEAGDLRIDPARRRVARGGVPVALPPKELAILETFVRRPGRVPSPLRLLESVWDRASENRSNIVDVYARDLRAKIDEPFGVRSIETVRGAGDLLRPDGGCSAGSR